MADKGIASVCPHIDDASKINGPSPFRSRMSVVLPMSRQVTSSHRRPLSRRITDVGCYFRVRNKRLVQKLQRAELAVKKYQKEPSAWKMTQENYIESLLNNEYLLRYCADLGLAKPEANSGPEQDMILTEVVFGLGPEVWGRGLVSAVES
ncbi:uncharacterized protein BDZ99DRAFT_525848 [Mytilinidion resinicola]|uniref:Uncharacterized protein n=1 Tax=Mytilinidion resinicola TaxID=574789 RepID=A0A6A6Y6V2_9PEZI|nr:uncharacterized protein BDZ99DRAFT_525848 [Mytilinidion resinicola]KAF2804253.1 hypothetical protein BDZ99DRAFT_525848 [Mytilinidion resinicola]